MNGMEKIRAVRLKCPWIAWSEWCAFIRSNNALLCELRKHIVRMPWSAFMFSNRTARKDMYRSLPMGKTEEPYFYCLIGIDTCSCRDGRMSLPVELVCPCRWAQVSLPVELRCPCWWALVSLPMNLGWLGHLYLLMWWEAMLFPAFRSLRTMIHS